MPIRSPDYVTKRGNTAMPVTSTLSDERGIRDLTNAVEVKLLLRLHVSRALTELDADVDGTPTSGNVIYEWQPGDTDTAGWYDYEWRVTFSDGEVATFPSQNYLLMHIEESLR